MKKQIFSLIILALLPLVASADAVEIDGIYYNLIPKGKVAEVKSNPNKYTGVVEIPDSVEYEGETYVVTSIGERAFYYLKSLTSVIIPYSVTSIGESAFEKCTGLESVTIPNSVTSIGEKAFDSCSGLTSLTIPNSVTSIGGNAFSGCTGLKSVTIPNSITSISGGVFSACVGLTSVTIPNSVTSIEIHAFTNCSSLTSVTIPNSVTSIGYYAFSYCRGLTSVTIGSGIKTIKQEAFSNCAQLTDVYCLAENVPYTDATAFDGSLTEYATLHVPASAINTYKGTAPWSKFKEIVPTEDVAIEKCATPTVTFADGMLKFGCETEGVEYVYEVTMSSAGTTAEDEVELKPTFRVTVYAQKEGYENSDIATKDIKPKYGDLSGDGEVNAVDLTKLIEILLKR